MNINELARQVKEASLLLAVANTEMKDKALRLIAAALQTRKDEIISANRADLERSKNENLPAPLLKRLKFDEAKIADVTEGIVSLLALADPVGKTLLSTELDDGLELYKVSCPIGVIGV
ncbi:MAG: gamma-glutamyl-phosphate reductase, partial [Dethiobacter sp.]|nr:gamma-glutamyl-phosphate reductase [Dethiobacter sp.]